jgi:hypothetical protein
VAEIAVESEGRRLGASYLRAEDESLATDAGRPCVVMAHGFGATRARACCRSPRASPRRARTCCSWTTAGSVARRGSGAARSTTARTSRLTWPDAAPGYGSIIGPSFVNDMPARGILTIPLNRPVTAAPRGALPDASGGGRRRLDRSARRRAAGGRDRRWRVETLELDCGHFDIYLGEPSATSLERQIGFLRSL